MGEVLISMMAVATALLMASCAKEIAPEQPVGEGDTLVSFSVGLEAPVATRAVNGDGTNCNTLIYSVYDQRGTVLEMFNDETPYQNATEMTTDATSGKTTAEVKLRLAKGQTYTIVFWAQNDQCTAYSTSDLTAVKVNYGANNYADADAFYCAFEHKVVGDATVPVTLKRPFAQLNLGTTAGDITAAKAAGIEIIASEVTLSNVAHEINLLTGKVDDVKAVTFDKSEIPSGVISVTKENAITDYTLLSTGYFLVDDAADNTNKQSGLITQAEFKLYDKDGDIVNLKNGLVNLPVQRNYRTNIVGELLTNEIKFDIVIDPIFETPAYDHVVADVMVVNTVADIEAAISAGAKSVTVKEAITAETTIELPGNTPDGFTLVLAETDQKVTISSTGTTSPATVNVEAPGTGERVINLPDSHVILNGTVYGTVTVEAVSSSTLVVEAGVKVAKLHVKVGAVEIYGEVTELVLDNGVVLKKYAATTAAGIVQALQSGAESLSLGSDVTVEDVIEMPASAALDLAGNTLTADQIVWEAVSKATISNGTLELNEDLSLDVQKGGSELTLDNVTVNSPNSDKAVIAVTRPDEEANRPGKEGNVKLTINNSTINATGKEAQAILVHGAGNVVTVSGSTINHNWYGITQNGKEVTGSKYTVTGTTINGTYSGIYLGNDKGENTAANTLVVDGCNITSELESAIEVKWTNISVKNSTLASKAESQKYTYNYGGSGAEGYGIALAHYDLNVPYEGTVDIYNNNNTFNLAAPNAESIYMSYRHEDGIYYLGSKEGLFWFNDQVNKHGNEFYPEGGEKVVVKLELDIDLENELWEPIGNYVDGAGRFRGVFDGNGHTIKNLYVDSKVTDNDAYGSGFFGWLEQGGPVVRNIRIDGATVKGHHYMGAVVGYSYADLESCFVTNVHIYGTHISQDVCCGDKAGAIVGYMGEGSLMTNCQATQSTVQASRDAGQLIGAAQASSLGEGNSATAVTVTGTGDCDHSSVSDPEKNGYIRNELIGRVL